MGCETLHRMCILLLHSHGCTTRGVHLEPRRYCRPCRLAGRVPLPGAAGSAPCDDRAPRKSASRSDRVPLRAKHSCIQSYSEVHRGHCAWNLQSFPTFKITGKIEHLVGLTWHFSACTKLQRADVSSAHQIQSSRPPVDTVEALWAGGWGAPSGYAGS